MNILHAWRNRLNLTTRKASFLLNQDEQIYLLWERDNSAVPDYIWSLIRFYLDHPLAIKNRLSAFPRHDLAAPSKKRHKHPDRKYFNKIYN